MAEVGAGRVLALVYGFFTLAAGARSGVQLATRARDAPVAYGLSALAAGIYLLGMIAVLLAERRPPWRRRAALLCQIELAGVLVIGTASLLLPQAFPDATVWSHYGSGYGFVPLLLPVLALIWLHGTTLAPSANSATTKPVTSGRSVTQNGE